MKSTPLDAAPASLLERVVEHYHRSFCTSRAAQAYLTRRGLTNPDLLKAFRIGYADGSLLNACRARASSATSCARSG